MIKHLVIIEYGIIRRASDYPPSERASTLKNRVVSDAVFASLKDLAFRANVEGIFDFFIQKGRECLRIKNFVGLLQTERGIQIEILPKIGAGNDIEEARVGLLKMLQYVPYLPFYSFNQAHLQQVRLPIWEIFVTMFIEEVEKITQQGIQKSYITVENQQPFLKGKWLLNRQSYIHSKGFYVATDEFLTDIIPNRLIKTCLVFLAKSSNLLSNQTRLRRLCFAWKEVDFSNNTEVDFKQVRHLGKSFERYQRALQWAAILLNQGSWYGAGQNLNQSLLFPTEQLFEHYVAMGFKKYLTDFEVSYQDRVHHLLNDHLGKNRFGLRPDWVLKRGEKTIVIDAKWKWIEPNAPNFGIEQADLYQLYAYGKKYKADQLFLIYPAHASFTFPLPPFFYDKHLILMVVPFQVTKSLGEQMQVLIELMGVSE
ncbi:MAG: McrC family protein [Spirosomataceae bacterium]